MAKPIVVSDHETALEDLSGWSLAREMIGKVQEWRLEDADGRTILSSFDPVPRYLSDLFNEAEDETKRLASQPTHDEDPPRTGRA